MSANVLLAEDDVTSRQIYFTVLVAEGYHVIEVGDGNSALEVLRGQPVDLLITDIMMPGMTGIELLQRAREIRPDLRAIVMTGHKTSEAVIGALRNQACEFLEKPFRTEELVEAVRDVVSRDLSLQIEVISDRPDWIELRVPCDLSAVEPIQRFLGHLHEHIPKETREAVGAVFRELLNNAIEHGGKQGPCSLLLCGPEIGANRLEFTSKPDWVGAYPARQGLVDPRRHFGRASLGEGQAKNLRRFDPGLKQQPEHARRQHLGFARTRRSAEPDGVARLDGEALVVEQRPDLGIAAAHAACSPALSRSRACHSSRRIS